jgi:hypothetical protein
VWAVNEGDVNPVIEIEYKHDEAIHAAGGLCPACHASLATLPVAQFTCPECGGHERNIDVECGYVLWMTCVGCGWRQHGQSCQIEHGRKFFERVDTLIEMAERAALEW